MDFPWLYENFVLVTREPPDIVRHAEAECMAWKEANSRVIAPNEIPRQPRLQVLPLREVFLVDGSWKVPR